MGTVADIGSPNVRLLTGKALLITGLLDQTGFFSDDPVLSAGFQFKTLITHFVEYKPVSVYFAELCRAGVFYLFVG
jgi:hypothetical protein